jgi:aspartyl-tRNA(Asn)/glutamyl-tRNA(Gln) amidotransferase subunit C
MSVDQDTVRRIAHLARIAIQENQVEPMVWELNGILDWVEQLNEVETDGVPPMTSVVEAKLPMREDVVTDGGYPEDLTRNAPRSEDNFFRVPKVVE